MKRERGQVFFIMTFIAPAFFLFTVFVAIPSVRALAYSLQKWDGLSEPEWVGFSNFVHMFSEGDLFIPALRHNLFLTVVGGALVMTLSLFFASVLHRRVRGANVFRVAFFFPNVISAVAIALLWMLLYSTTDFGVINGILRWAQQTFGWPGIELPFPFVNSRYLIYSIVPMMAWTFTGFYMILFLAAMENIPESLYEAAKLDGAGPFAQFRHITLPLIREVLTVGLVFLIITTLKYFDPVWVMENQRPTKDSHVMATVLYQKAFSEYNVGYGSAVAVLLFILVFASTFLTLRLSRKEALEY